MTNKQLFLALVLLGIVLRLLPHPSNVAPVSALAIVSILFIKSKYAVLIPLIVSLITDFYLGFHSTMAWVYGSYLMIFALSWASKNHITLKKLIPTSLIASSLFFVVTNFGVWLSTSMYTKDWQGLVECFTLALPFFRNTILGDMFFTVTLYTLYKLYSQRNLLSAQRKYFPLPQLSIKLTD